jgi:hypothetical protein
MEHPFGVRNSTSRSLRAGEPSPSLRPLSQVALVGRFRERGGGGMAAIADLKKALTFSDVSNTAATSASRTTVTASDFRTAANRLGRALE